MRFHELATVVKKYNRMGGGTLIIMPYFKNFDALSEHLSLLNRQTVQAFDLIVVMNALSDERKVKDIVEKSGCRFGIVLVKRKEDNGSAGGYCTGERYAIENGYRAVIIGDDDCHPAEPTLLEKSVSAWKAGNRVTVPESRFFKDGQQIYASRSIVYYGLLDISLIKSRGLHYIPAYIGADDAEFCFRILSGERMFPVDSYVIHPAQHSIFADFNRSLLYRVNTMLLVIPNRPADFFFGFAAICPVFIIFGSPMARRGGLHILKSVVLHRFGKAALPAEVPYGEAPPSAFDAIISSSSARKGQNIVFYDYSQLRGGFSRIPEFASSVWGKVVMLDLVQNHSVLASMMCAKETWIESAKGTYLIARNTNTLSRMLKILAFALAFPLFMAAGVPAFLISWARKPRTKGYGLD